MRITEVNDVELEYEVTGAGEPVLLISPVLADGFRPVVSQPVLADHQLISYHKRGWAGSTHTEAPVSVEDHALDAAALLAHLGLPRAHVAGHSSGAAVAVQLALDHPELVHSLCLLELSPLSWPSAEGLLQEAGPVFDAYASGDHEAAITRFLCAVSGLGADTCTALLEERIPGASAQAVKDADTFFGVELPALTQWTFGAEEAARIHQPVLSVWGTETESLWLDVADQLRSWLPQVEDCEIDGVGHLLHIQDPEPVARGMAAFFGRHPLAG